jgi:hypothetical protein
VYYWQVTQGFLDRLDLVSVEDLFKKDILREKIFPMVVPNGL